MPRMPSPCISAAGTGSAQAATRVEGIEFMSLPANVSDVVDDISRWCHHRYRTISNMLATTEPCFAFRFELPADRGSSTYGDSTWVLAQEVVEGAHIACSS
ncbi:hypothetical protein E2562_004973 [Oryza meyeriana var. granulata]|uniref:Uncharacterized protein n=1 Tax=Oryza meyeriana var. granulata TaxID=110450 RepID=A0A6G1C597_9ORYZ|nr:hypothetical protein E2562_004973 [Oryza meyeriana var. granulata]